MTERTLIKIIAASYLNGLVGVVILVLGAQRQGQGWPFFLPMATTFAVWFLVGFAVGRVDWFRGCGGEEGP